jgi:hypothetical protein
MLQLDNIKFSSIFRIDRIFLPDRVKNELSVTAQNYRGLCRSSAVLKAGLNEKSPAKGFGRGGDRRRIS